MNFQTGYASAVSAAAETEPRTASFVKIRKKSCGRKRMTTAATEMRTLRNKTQTQKSRRSPGCNRRFIGNLLNQFCYNGFFRYLFHLPHYHPASQPALVLLPTAQSKRIFFSKKSIASIKLIDLNSPANNVPLQLR